MKRVAVVIGMKIRILTLVITILILLIAPQIKAQNIRVDKTTSEGRTILTTDKDYGGIGRYDRIALHYLCEGENEFFLIAIYFDEIGRLIYEGHKMLLKQASGHIMELTCLYGAHKDATKFSFIHPLYTDIEPFDNSNFLISREEVELLIADPVEKIRIEYNRGYFDITIAPDKETKKSKFSELIRAAYSEINNALKTKKTGLYDGF